MDPGYSMTIEELKSWNIDLINQVRTQKIYNGYTDANSNVWDTRPVDIANINGVCTLIALGVVTTSVTWRDKNNENHTMTPVQMIQLAAGMAVYIQTCYGVSWYHKENVNAISDIPNVLYYDINVGWPS